MKPIRNGLLYDGERKRRTADTFYTLSVKFKAALIDATIPGDCLYRRFIFLFRSKAFPSF